MTALYTQWLIELGPVSIDSGFYFGQLFSLCNNCLKRFYCKKSVDTFMRTW